MVLNKPTDRNLKRAGFNVKRVKTVRRKVRSFQKKGFTSKMTAAGQLRSALMKSKVLRG